MGRWTTRVLAPRAAAISSALAVTALATTVAPAQAATNPNTNWQPSAQTDSACVQSGLQCDVAVLTDINAARAAEGVGPMTLPTNYESLSQAQQILVVTNLERTGRGLVPASGLSASLDTVAAAAAASDVDPDPSTYNGDALASNWAGGIESPLLVDFYWMYDDGPGSPNIDCGSPTDPGCWVHRDNILYPFNAPLAFGAAELDNSSVTELFVGGDTTIVPGAADALVGPSWSTLSQTLQPALSATALSFTQTTGTQQLRISASQGIRVSASTTAGWQVSPTSCQLSAGASCELTVSWDGGATAGSGKLTLSGPAGSTTVSLSSSAAANSTVSLGSDTATSSRVTKAPVPSHSRPRHRRRARRK